MADIIIRGFDLGDTKRGCPFRADTAFGDCYCVAGADVCYADFDERGPDCPVDILQAGHGRLGDLDSLQEEFKKSHDGKRLMLIDTAPTIVPADVTDIDVGNKKEGGKE